MNESHRPLIFDDQPDMQRNHFDGDPGSPIVRPRHSGYYLPEAAKQLKHRVQLYPVKIIRGDA